MIVGIHQPNYLPWLGFFYKMSRCDVFVLLDDVDINLGGASAITHRTKTMGSNGPVQLSIPLKRDSGPAIREVKIALDGKWNSKHRQTLDGGYAKAQHYASIRPFLHASLESPPETLSALNVALIEGLKNILQIRTRTVLSSELGIPAGSPSDRLSRLCRAVGGDVYLSGNGARSYNEPSVFESHGVRLQYSAFQHPTYEQGRHAFTPGLSVVDAIAWTGAQTASSFLASAAE
ncbi:MAG: WbqC family protein [Vicinamibacteria bacterium]